MTKPSENELRIAMARLVETSKAAQDESDPAKRQRLLEEQMDVLASIGIVSVGVDADGKKVLWVTEEQAEQLQEVMRGLEGGDAS